MQQSKSETWLLLIHQIPAKPDYLRVRIGRRLRHLGAVAIKSSVYAVPPVSGMRVALATLVQDILQRGGEAAVCEASFVEGLSDGAIEDLHREACDAEYSGITREARRLADGLKGRHAPDEARRRAAARALDRLRLKFDEIVSRDRFGAGGRESAAGSLSLLEDRIQGVDQGLKRGAAPPESPHGATWVTRTGVMVDRIASAWLIRRFIDAEAEFKFVPARGYRVGAGEIRFDMSGAEFTHDGGHCTFEVLAQRFRLRDSALGPIGQIVHDLDLEDGKYGRPEAAGVGRMIIGLAIAKPSDDARLAEGGALFDSLYESFRRRSH